MKKIFLVYGHYNDNSFNAAIRDEFIKGIKKAKSPKKYLMLAKNRHS